MRFYLISDTNVEPLIKGQDHATKQLKGGLYYSGIEWHNLPEYIQESVGEYTTKEIKRFDVFVVYVNRIYWAVCRREVHVPTINCIG